MLQNNRSLADRVVATTSLSQQLREMHPEGDVVRGGINGRLQTR